MIIFVVNNSGFSTLAIKNLFLSQFIIVLVKKADKNKRWKAKVNLGKDQNSLGEFIFPTRSWILKHKYSDSQVFG